VKKSECQVRRARRVCRSGVFMMLLASAPIANLRAQAPKPVDRPLVPESSAAATVPQTSDYVIGPDDVLNVYILDVPEFSRAYRVSNTGTVTVPSLSSPLTAAGLTLSKFSELLAKELKAAGVVMDARVTTSVDQSRLHAISITGSVRNPQIYPLFTQTTLLDVLSQAGGLADDASNIAIVRRGDIAIHALNLNNGDTPTDDQAKATQSVTVDLKKLLEGNDAHVNVDVYPGDRITVPRAGIVYVVGAVNKPGGFTMRANSRGVTVLQALALAQDTKTTALRNQSVILRDDAQSPDGRKQIPVDLKKIVRGTSPDPLLQADDILFVPDSGSKRAFRRGIEAVLQVTTGVAIYSSRF
jgi:polysaccharide biosynthesis/export protein